VDPNASHRHARTVARMVYSCACVCVCVSCVSPVVFSPCVVTLCSPVCECKPKGKENGNACRCIAVGQPTCDPSATPPPGARTHPSPLPSASKWLRPQRVLHATTHTTRTQRHIQRRGHRDTQDRGEKGGTCCHLRRLGALRMPSTISVMCVMFFVGPNDAVTSSLHGVPSSWSTFTW
jgi:hypothetical protein